jgi:hypothetical protein
MAYQVMGLLKQGQSQDSRSPFKLSRDIATLSFGSGADASSAWDDFSLKFETALMGMGLEGVLDEPAPTTEQVEAFWKPTSIKSPVLYPDMGDDATYAAKVPSVQTAYASRYALRMQEASREADLDDAETPSTE